MIPGKWMPLITAESRKTVLDAIMRRIKHEARLKGLPDSYLQMSKLLRAQGVKVSDSYFYAHSHHTNTNPFPLEAIIAICKGYGIPLETIFNPDLFKDNEADSPEV